MRISPPRLAVTLTATAVAAVLAAGAAAAHSTTPAPQPSPSHTGSHTGQPTAQDAVQLYTTKIAPLGKVGGVTITGSGYGSSFVAKHGSSTIFYGLTDRGPNVDGPNGTKIEPLPDFHPQIGEFRLDHGTATLLRKITLSAADGTPYNGQVNIEANTGETITDLSGKTLPASPYGYDSEGLVAMRDGTFWVSDEYGPFITHFDRNGRQLERLSPFDGSLPTELRTREPNKGMEGLTITPDGSTLVGMMQAALNAPDGPKSKNSPVLRIVTINLRSRVTHQYLYLLHTTDSGVSTAVSEIAALSNTDFLVDERDGNVEPGANKKLYRISLTGATDVSKNSRVPGATYDGLNGGLLVGGKTIEGIVGKKSTADGASALAGVGINPVRSSLFLDVAGLATAIAPDGSFFGHDKLEGVAVLDGGRRVVISNDSDFGIAGVTGITAPFTLTPKLLPNGRQDDGEFLAVDMTKVPAQFRS